MNEDSSYPGLLLLFSSTNATFWPLGTNVKVAENAWTFTGVWKSRSEDAWVISDGIRSTSDPDTPGPIIRKLVLVPQAPVDAKEEQLNTWDAPDGVGFGTGAGLDVIEGFGLPTVEAEFKLEPPSSLEVQAPNTPARALNPIIWLEKYPNFIVPPKKLKTSWIAK
jgi:hypothetical protein